MPHSIVIPQSSTGVDYDLTTVEEVNSALGITGDTEADAETATEITTYSKLIAEICDRTFAQQTVVETFMLHEHWLHALALRNYPVTEIVSVRAGGVALSASEYKLEPDGGLLWRWGTSACGGWSCGEVEVTYTAGYDLPSGAPTSLARACIEMIQDVRLAGQGRGGNTAIRDIAYNDRRVSFFEESVSAANAALSSSVADLLRPFKRISI